MPRVTWLKAAVKPKRGVNHLAMVLRGYKLASGLTSEDLGKRLGCTADNVRRQIGKPADQWNIGALLRYCDELSIPYEEALSAAAKTLAKPS